MIRVSVLRTIVLLLLHSLSLTLLRRVAPESVGRRLRLSLFASVSWQVGPISCEVLTTILLILGASAE